MGKVRPPEEVAARKAKKEAKKAAAAEIAKKAAQDKAAAKAAASKAQLPAGKAGEEPPAKRRRKASDGGATKVPARPSLEDRLNPASSNFDPAFLSVWKTMSKEDKARMRAEEKQVQTKAKKEAGTAEPSLPKYPFTPQPEDHCETSPAAYADIAPLLTLLAKRLGKEPSELKIYDPYFCAGAVKRHLGALGFTDVHNECEDFYARLAADDVPEHDVVVSNPPYSEAADGGANHVAKLLRFCAKRGTPFLLNMPEYVTSAAYYAKRFSGEQEAPLLLCPLKRYHFWTPFGLRDVANKQAHRHPELGIRSSPFVSMWYVSLEPVVSHDKLLRRATKGSLEGIKAAPADEGNDEEDEPEEGAKERCWLCRETGQLPPGRATFSGKVPAAARPVKRSKHKKPARPSATTPSKQRRAAARAAAREAAN